MGISRAGQAALEAVVPGYERVAAVRAHAREPRHGDERSASRRSSSRRTRRTTCGSSSARVTRGGCGHGSWWPCSTRWAPPMPSVTSSSAMRERYDDDRLRVGPIKLYIDDVIEPWTAAMLEPYANRPGERGEHVLAARGVRRAGDRARAPRVVRATSTAPATAGSASRWTGSRRRAAANGATARGTAWCTRECLAPRRRAAVRRARGHADHAAASLRARDRRRLARQRGPERDGGTRGRSVRSATPAPRSRSPATGTSPRWTRSSASTPRSRGRTSMAPTRGSPRRRSTWRPRSRAYTMGGASVVLRRGPTGVDHGRQAGRPRAAQRGPVRGRRGRSASHPRRARRRTRSSTARSCTARSPFQHVRCSAAAVVA